MGIVHQQRYQRDRTIDAQPNDPIAEPFLVLAKAIEQVTQRVTGLEAALRAVTSLEADLASRVTALEAPGTTRDTTWRHAHAERQRRYRERKKQHGAADSER